jgi:hypothetical protein
MWIILFFLCLISVFCAATRHNRTDVQVQTVTSKIDGRNYIVRDLPDKNAAADALARLYQKIQQLQNFLAHTEDRHTLGVRRLKAQFQGAISERTIESIYTSYTVNKGEHIYMCIRDDDRIINENTIFFVALHELAHIMTVSSGHTKEFWANFRLILKHAIANGLYTYEPYHRKPQPYCGIQIKNTPLK